MHSPTHVFQKCFRLLCATYTCLFFFLFLNSAVVRAENTSPGLDTKPVNSTCIALEPPPVFSSAKAAKVFAKLELEQPAAMVQPAMDSSIWVFASRLGKIKIFESDPSIDIDTVALNLEHKFVNINHVESGPSTESQQWGITSIALDPDFDQNGYLYIAYNTKIETNGPVLSIVSRYTLIQGTHTFDLLSEKTILSLSQNKPWHHFGQIAFGNDKLLYIGSGDGGIKSNAQNLNNLYGKILRIDVHEGDPYAIPIGNPFTSGGGAGEIFAWGVRNPWRFSFDRNTGVLFAGDVGWRTVEEVNIIETGKNYGWPILEGSQCVVEGCVQTGLTPPIHEYLHTVGRAVIGGFVYRGQAIPGLKGAYIFGDTTGTLWKLENDENNNWAREEILRVPPPSSFAQDNEGELYIFHVNRASDVRKILPNTNNNPPSAPDTLASLLSNTGCVNPDDPSQPAAGMIPYSINAPLWSDGAEKHRWLGLPEGQKVSIDESGDFNFPIGTVLMKNFAFEGILFETRLFMRHPNGEWGGYSYEWLEDLSDAVLLSGSKSKTLGNGVKWDYPSRTQCLECHSAAAGFALGPEIAQLNRQNYYPSTNRTSNQLTTWEHIELIEGGLNSIPINLPAFYGTEVNWISSHLRARGYLHSNCSGCHRPGGPAQGIIDLRFNAPMEMNICEVAPTTNVGDMFVYPGDPSKSAISIRMHTQGKDRMPPLGTTLVDTLGTALIDNWILDADVCLPDSDSDEDGVVDHADNCQTISNADQQDTDKDGYGNLCDGDLNNDGSTNTLDLNIYRAAHRSTIGDVNYNVNADFNSDGSINTLDLNIYRALHRNPPGPSCCGLF